jgi:hypothetical protein
MCVDISRTECYPYGKKNMENTGKNLIYALK